MANREKGGRVVFIGNIPYGVSEEQIMDIFGRAGTVVGFRLVYDKETGQPKGFGFLEYTDTDAAASAVRNLNEFELNGRTLRVDYSNDNRSTNQAQNQNNQQQDGSRAQPPASFNMSAPPARPDPSALPPLPQGTPLPPGVTAFDAISQTINAVSTPELLDFISQVKNLCAANPHQATTLFQQTPQLAYAVFQAMLLLNLVNADIVTQLVSSVPAQAAPVQPPQSSYAAPATQPYQQPAPQQQSYPPQQQAYPPQPPQGYPPQPPQGYPPQYAPTPPQAQPAYNAPAPAPAPAPAAAQGQQELIKQVLALSRDQIFAMPEPHRAQIIELRRAYGAPVN